VAKRQETALNREGEAEQLLHVSEGGQSQLIQGQLNLQSPKLEAGGKEKSVRDHSLGAKITVYVILSSKTQKQHLQGKGKMIRGRLRRGEILRISSKLTVKSS